MHAHDILRDRLLTRAGIIKVPTTAAPEELWRTEWSTEFERLRHERMVIGSYRYGRFSEYAGPERNLPLRAIRRIEMYQETGNTEYLVDAANFLMIEFEVGKHPKKHFRTIHEGHDRSKL